MDPTFILFDKDFFKGRLTFVLDTAINKQLFPRSSIPKLAGAPPGRNSSPPYLNIFFVRDLREYMNV